MTCALGAHLHGGPRARLERATYCLEDRLTQRADLRVRRSQVKQACLGDREAPRSLRQSGTQRAEQCLRPVDRLGRVYLPGDRVESQAMTGVGAPAGKVRCK